MVIYMFIVSETWVKGWVIAVVVLVVLLVIAVIITVVFKCRRHGGHNIEEDKHEQQELNVKYKA